MEDHEPWNQQWIQNSYHPAHCRKQKIFRALISPPFLQLCPSLARLLCGLHPDVALAPCSWAEVGGPDLWTPGPARRNDNIESFFDTTMLNKNNNVLNLGSFPREGWHSLNGLELSFPHFPLHSFIPNPWLLEKMWIGPAPARGSLSLGTAYWTWLPQKCPLEQQWSQSTYNFLLSLTNLITRKSVY